MKPGFPVKSLNFGSRNARLDSKKHHWWRVFFHFPRHLQEPHSQSFNIEPTEPKNDKNDGHPKFRISSSVFCVVLLLVSGCQTLGRYQWLMVHLRSREFDTWCFQCHGKSRSMNYLSQIRSKVVHDIMYTFYTVYIFDNLIRIWFSTYHTLYLIYMYLWLFDIGKTWVQLTRPQNRRYLAALEATYKEAIRGTESAGRPLEVW